MRRLLFDRSTFLITLIFVVATALIFFLMGLTFKHLKQQDEDSNLMHHSYDVSLHLEKLYSLQRESEYHRRNFILDREKSQFHVEEISKINDKSDSILSSLHLLLSDDESQIKNLKQLQSFVEIKSANVQNTLQSPIPENNLEARRLLLLSSDDAISDIHNKIVEMMSAERKLMKERKEKYAFTQKYTPIYIYVISLFSLALLIFAFVKIFKDVKSHKIANHQLNLSLETSKLAEEVGAFGIAMLDPNKVLNYFSDNQFRLLGTQPNSFPVTFDNFKKFVHPEDLSNIERKTDELLKTGLLPAFVYRVITEDGLQKHIQSVGKSIKTANGENVMLIISTDVTHEFENRMKLEATNWMLNEKNKNLSISNETFGEAEKIGNFGTWQWFIKENKFIFSDNLIRLFGFDPNNFESELENFLPTMHPDDADFVGKKIAMMYNLEPIPTFTHRIYRNDTGEMRYLTISSKKINDEQTGEYVLFITQDTTEDVLAKKSIEEKNITLEANNKELEAFNYVASHDLQEPLRKIETFISRLDEKDRDNISDSGVQYLDRIKSAAGRMRRLINDLLQFSRTTRHEQVYKISDLNQLAKDALEELHHPINEKNAKISIDPLPKLKVVPFQIQQLFINLIGNSLKYAKKDVAPEITVSVSKVRAADTPEIPIKSLQNFYKISFADNGIGFEQQYAHKIFTVFNRLHGKLEYEGTGIGLAICKKILDNHNGFIFAEGTPNIGATFTVYLPE